MRGACAGLSLLMLVVTINGCHRNAIAQSSEEKSGGPLANMCDFSPLDTTNTTNCGQVNLEDQRILVKKLDMVDKDGDGMVSRDEFQNIVQQPLQEEQLDHIWWYNMNHNNETMEKMDLLYFWDKMCAHDGDFRKFLCLINENYSGQKLTYHDFLQSKYFLGASEEIKKKEIDRFTTYDFNWDGSVDENEVELVFNLYCEEGEKVTESSSTSPLP